MDEVTHILEDTDAASLEARVLRVVEDDAEPCVVTRFTYWYTGREPVHEAVVRHVTPPAGEPPAALAA
jgi:hypothetical protein